jgi:hypothetical protein
MIVVAESLAGGRERFGYVQSIEAVSQPLLLRFAKQDLTMIALRGSSQRTRPGDERLGRQSGSRQRRPDCCPGVRDDLHGIGTIRRRDMRACPVVHLPLYRETSHLRRWNGAGVVMI